MQIDWKAIIEEIGALAGEKLESLVDSGRDDLKAYGKDLAKSLVIAIRSGREDLQDEIYEQIEMLAEIHRIELNQEARDMLDSMLAIGLRVGKVALAAL